MHTFAKPSGSGRFSLATVITSVGECEWVLIDTQDKTLWNFDMAPSPGRLTELHLSDGDHLVRVEPLFFKELLELGFASATSNFDVIVGEKGTYMWFDGRFQRFTSELVESVRSARNAGALVTFDEAKQLLAVRARTVDPDPITPRVEFRDPAGDLVFEHRYEPQTIGDELRTVALHALALLHMPLGCITSFASSEPRNPTLASELLAVQEDALFKQGKRAWLLCANLALAGLCVLSIVRRMRDRGTDSALVLIATAFTIVFGVVAYLYFRFLLPKRATLRETIESRGEARQLWIQSA